MDSEARPIWSCVACRRRKVKCDRRATPGCDACARAGVECHYPVTGRLPSRGRAPPQWSSPHHRQADLLARLRRLEAVVTELSAQVDEVHDPPPPAGTEMEEEQDEDFGRLVTGDDGRVRIARSFWSVFCDEVDHIFQSIQDASEGSGQEKASTEAEPSLCGCHVFGLGGDATLLAPGAMDVSPTQVSFLLQTYKERVDPFVKILATDTLKELSDSWSTPHSKLVPAQAALRSSVLFGAVVALSPAEVQAAFERPKKTLLAETRGYAETHLARSKYLSTRELTVIQALVIYTSMLPYAGMQDMAGPITASTVQVAIRNGLHTATERNKLGDSDVRQMIWLQVCFLSSRFEVADVAVSEWPPDVADTRACSERLYPCSQDQRALLFIRHTIWKLSRKMRQLGRTANTLEPVALVSAAKAAVEDQHQWQLHMPKRPFAEFIPKMSELFFSKLEHSLFTQKWQQHEKSPPASHALSDTTMTILEAMHALNTKPEWAPWRWQLQGLFPWAAMKLVFARFGDGRWTPQSERAWVLARAVAGSASDEVRADPAWAVLCKLMDVAEGHREREMQRLMADAMAGGDYMRIIEAGQQVFYSEGLAGGAQDQEEQLDLERKLGFDYDAWELGSHSSSLQKPRGANSWPDAAVSW